MSEQFSETDYSDSDYVREREAFHNKIFTRPCETDSESDAEESEGNKIFEFLRMFEDFDDEYWDDTDTQHYMIRMGIRFNRTKQHPKRKSKKQRK